MKLFIATRADKINWDECVEQTIAAHSIEEAIELACREFGVWEINEVDMSIAQVLTQSYNWG